MTINKNRWVTKKKIAVVVALLLLASLVWAVFQPGWSIFKSDNNSSFRDYDIDDYFMDLCSGGDVPKAYCTCVKDYLTENYSTEELNNLTSEEVRNAGYA